jgi:hypothetical protein
MFMIKKDEACLLVELRGDFDYSTVKQILYNETMTAEFGRMNDIWMIGNHHARLRLGDIQLLVDDFTRLFPRTVKCKKTAMVVAPGLTEAIIRLLANGIERSLMVSCRVFHTADDARQWLLAQNSQVA